MNFIHAERAQTYANRALAAVDPLHAAAVAAFPEWAVRYAAEFARHRFSYHTFLDSTVGHFGEDKHVKRSGT